MCDKKLVSEVLVPQTDIENSISAFVQCMLRDLLTFCPEDSVNKLPKCHGLFSFCKNDCRLKGKNSDEVNAVLPLSYYSNSPRASLL